MKAAIAFRKTHPLLHQAKELQGTSGSAFPADIRTFLATVQQAWYGNFETTSRHFGMMYCGEEGEYLYVAYNLHWKEQSFALPKLPEGLSWQLVFDTEDGASPEEGDQMDLDTEKSFEAPPKNGYGSHRLAGNLWKGET